MPTLIIRKKITIISRKRSWFSGMGQTSDLVWMRRRTFDDVFNQDLDYPRKPCPGVYVPTSAPVSTGAAQFRTVSVSNVVRVYPQKRRVTWLPSAESWKLPRPVVFVDVVAPDDRQAQSRPWIERNVSSSSLYLKKLVDVAIDLPVEFSRKLPWIVVSSVVDSTLIFKRFIDRDIVEPLTDRPRPWGWLWPYVPPVVDTTYILKRRQDIVISDDFEIVRRFGWLWPYVAPVVDTSYIFNRLAIEAVAPADVEFKRTLAALFGTPHFVFKKQLPDDVPGAEVIYPKNKGWWSLSYLFWLRRQIFDDVVAPELPDSRKLLPWLLTAVDLLPWRRSIGAPEVLLGLELAYGFKGLGWFGVIDLFAALKRRPVGEELAIAVEALRHGYPFSTPGAGVDTLPWRKRLFESPIDLPELPTVRKLILPEGLSGFGWIKRKSLLELDLLEPFTRVKYFPWPTVPLIIDSLGWRKSLIVVDSPYSDWTWLGASRIAWYLGRVAGYRLVVITGRDDTKPLLTGVDQTRPLLTGYDDSKEEVTGD